MPTFLGIGAQRCGTTWAYECLAEHPQVYVSQPKELRYFTKNYEKGPAWYESFFAQAEGYAARGEITPGYVYRPAALERIAKDLPDVKMFVFLRNPIERAFSAYKFFSDRYYRGMSFKQAMECDPEIVGQGQYVPCIRRLRSLFDSEQVLILVYDDVTTAPDDVIRRIYRFIGVDDSYLPRSNGQRLNATILPGTQSLLRRFHLERLVDVVKNSSVGPHIRRRLAGRNATVASNLQEEDRQFLADAYSDDVRELSGLLQRDLSGWLR